MHNGARRLLRLARERAGLTQAALARATNCSVSTIRAYESEHPGRQRNPTRDQLESLLHGVYAARDEATAIMEGFGFSTSRTLYPADQFPDYHFTPTELQAFVERVPWPEFVVNTAVDIVAAERLWGLSLADARASARSGAANLLAVAAHPAIADRIVNWSECVAVVVGTLKGHPERPESLQAPSRRFEDVIADFTAGESSRLRDLLDVWTTAPPLIPKVRWDYPVVWRDPEVGQIRFQSIVSTASEPAGLAFNDWIPEDAVSWSRLGGTRCAATQPGAPGEEDVMSGDSTRAWRLDEVKSGRGTRAYPRVSPRIALWHHARATAAVLPCARTCDSRVSFGCSRVVGGPGRRSPAR